ncbi:hypothetical protein ACHWQZ_G012384 [Mnemiopsis leidyi]
MNPEADSFSSNNGLISQKRKKKTKPNYNSTGNTLTFVKSPLRPSSYHNQTEDLRDVHYDYLWKFICVGDCTVGKSSVLNFYKNVYFNPVESKPTPGLSLVETRVNFHRYRIHMQLWDTSGDPRFSCLTASLYRDSMAFLLMFDLTNRSSFQSVKVWVDHIRTHAAKAEPVIYLVGNKADLLDKRVVTEEEAVEVQKQLDLEKYLECGVFDGDKPDRTRVVQLFSEILNEMIQSIDREIENQTKTLINHKVFKAKLKQKELFSYKSEDPGLCGCCSCLPILR